MKDRAPSLRDCLLFGVLIFLGVIFGTIVTINAEQRRADLVEAYNSSNYYQIQYENWRDENDFGSSSEV